MQEAELTLQEAEVTLQETEITLQEAKLALQEAESANWQVLQEDLEAGVVEIAPGHKVLHPVPVELTFQDVSYELHPASKQTPGSKPMAQTVIHTCSGRLATRTAVALMGPSGAGRLLYSNCCSARYSVTGVPLAI